MKVRTGNSYSYINPDYVREVSIPSDKNLKGEIYFSDGDAILSANVEDCEKLGRLLCMKSSPGIMMELGPDHKVEFLEPGICIKRAR